MGKRSDFPRRANDAYLTWDKRAVPPLLPHLETSVFVEPCGGAGHLVDQLEAAGLHCVSAFDIAPLRFDIEYGDATSARIPNGVPAITNPPWSRPLLHAIIENLAAQGPVWLLFDADWAQTRQARPYLKSCHKIVAVGRLRWVEGSDHDAQDSCAWYLFGPNAPAFPLFIGRG